MADTAALVVYAALLAAAAVVVWRRPVSVLFIWIVGLALHNAVLAALYAGGVRGAPLTLIQAWKEILLAVACLRVLLDAARARRLPYRPRAVDWLALAFALFALAYALVPQHVLGGVADHKAVAYAFRHDVVPVVVFLLFRALELTRRDLRLLAWTLVAAAAAVAAAGVIDVYAIPIGWWRTNGTVAYFHKQLGYDYHGTGGLPENFVFNTGSEQHFLRRLVSTFLSPLGAAYMIVVALLMGWRVLAHRVGAVLGVVAFAGLLFTFTRAALLALAFGLVVLAVLRRAPLALVGGVAVVAIAVAWVHVFPKIGPTGHWTHADLVYQRALAHQRGGVKGGPGALSEPSVHSHLTNLREGVSTIVHHAQGYGLGNVGQVAKRFSTQIKAGESNYTEIGVETGLAGVLVWIAWNLTALVGLVRARAAATAAAFAAVLALAVQTDVIGDPWIAYCMWALAGAFCVRTAAGGERVRSRERPAPVATPA